jgi:transposase
MLSLVQTAEGLPIAHEVHPGNTAEAKTLLPMIRGLLERYPLKRVVLVADRGLLSVSNIEELAKRQTQLTKDGRDVVLEYILAVPAARYGDFCEDLKSLSDTQAAAQEWCAQTEWQGQRLVVAHDPQVAARRRQNATKRSQSWSPWASNAATNSMDKMRANAPKVVPCRTPEPRRGFIMRSRTPIWRM